MIGPAELREAIRRGKRLVVGGGELEDFLAGAGIDPDALRELAKREGGLVVAYHLRDVGGDVDGPLRFELQRVAEVAYAGAFVSGWVARGELGDP